MFNGGPVRDGGVIEVEAVHTRKDFFLLLGDFTERK